MNDRNAEKDDEVGKKMIILFGKTKNSSKKFSLKLFFLFGCIKQ